MTDDAIDTLITDCENRSDRLSEWESGFIDSIRRQYDTKGGLSDKQLLTLNKIWDKVTE